MKTSLECMPCFMKMALNDARLACPGDEAMHYAIVAAWGGKLGDLDLSEPPPAIARHLLDLIQSMTGCGDLYLEDKRQSNDRVKSLLPELRQMVEAHRQNHGESFELALELATIGNYIDRGVDLDVDWEAELRNVSASVSHDMIHELKKLAGDGADILILGDNTGEIVLDKLLVEEFIGRGCRVTYAVRSKPIINDATMADAVAVGMTDLCEVVESGVDTPGTVLNRCTPEFLSRMDRADLILAKGQGNFEALDGRRPGVYCAFKVKCPRVAQETGREIGASILWKTTGPAEGHAG